MDVGNCEHGGLATDPKSLLSEAVLAVKCDTKAALPSRNVLSLKKKFPV